nr:carboxypeptidase-like regulatory domain-containing protein [Bacteroides intestinalis]
MKTKLFLLLLVLCVLSAQAQNLSVKGRVTDTSQEAIIAANVSLWATDSTLVTGVTSDAQGKSTLNKIKAGNYRLAITFIGYQSEVFLLKLNNNLDLGDVQLQEDAVSLGEVTVSASNVLQRVDRQIILPTESQLKRSFGAYDLLNNLGIARLQVDNFTNSMSVSGGGAVQTRINGIKVTDKEIAAIRAKDVLRVEFIEDPGKQYGDDELGAVVNIILRRRETGGVVNFQLSDSPHTLWGENFLSAKFNYKNSEWGIDYFNKNGMYHSRLESHETFHLGDRTIDRIKEGIEDESPALSFINNLNLTYNLTKADKYVFNAIFRNNLNNAPYQNELNRMWAVGSTESIYSYVNNHTSSYSPALDLYFQHTLPHQQSIQMNVTGTLIHTKNNRKYKEYKDEHAPLADIQTLVDGDKRSVIGEAIYEKSFKDVKLSGGARHYQMRTENEYKGSNPTTSKMDQSQTSAFFEVQGKVKDFSYAGSVGMTRAWFKESDEDHAYYTFTPTVRLSYNLKKAGFLRYRFNISPAIPSLGSLTDVEQAIDTIQIVRGNPLLKTYQQFTNSLSYSYSKKQFNANLSVRHQYYDSPIMESIFVEDGKLILKDENQRSFQSLNAELMIGTNGATLFGLKDFLTLYASGGYTRSWSEGLEYSHTYDEFYYSVMAQLQYKGFSLLGQFRKVQNNFFGETIKKNENQTAFMAMYAKQNFQAGMGVLFPFTNNYKVGKERISEVAPFRSETFVKETGQMLILRVGYTFEFGRRHKAGNKELNNSDTDSGIIDMQR